MGYKNYSVPTVVPSISHQPIQRVALSSKHLVVFCPTCVTTIEPTSGPVEGSSRLVLKGSGFWAADNIVVRFTPIFREGSQEADDETECVEYLTSCAMHKCSRFLACLFLNHSFSVSPCPSFLVRAYSSSHHISPIPNFPRAIDP